MTVGDPPYRLATQQDALDAGDYKDKPILQQPLVEKNGNAVKMLIGSQVTKYGCTKTIAKDHDELNVFDQNSDNKLVIKALLVKTAAIDNTDDPIITLETTYTVSEFTQTSYTITAKPIPTKSATLYIQIGYSNGMFKQITVTYPSGYSTKKFLMPSSTSNTGTVTRVTIMNEFTPIDKLT